MKAQTTVINFQLNGIFSLLFFFFITENKLNKKYLFMHYLFFRDLLFSQFNVIKFQAIF